MNKCTEGYVFSVTLDPMADSLDAQKIGEKIRKIDGVGSVIVSVTEGAGKKLINGPESLGKITWENGEGSF